MNETAKAGLKYAAAVAVAIALPLTQQSEGLRLDPYYDVTGTLTVCFGETHNVKRGERKTEAECRDMLKKELTRTAEAIQPFIKVPVSPQELAAYADFSYNAGVGAFQKSTLLLRLNMGDHVGACQALSKWIYSKGKVLPGLIVRRANEKTICLNGASQWN